MIGKGAKGGDSDIACEIPNIDPFSSSIMKLIGDVRMPDCSPVKSYGKLVNGKIRFLGKFKLFRLREPFFYP